MVLEWPKEEAVPLPAVLPTNHPLRHSLQLQDSNTLQDIQLPLQLQDATQVQRWLYRQRLQSYFNCLQLLTPTAQHLHHLHQSCLNMAQEAKQTHALFHDLQRQISPLVDAYHKQVQEKETLEMQSKVMDQLWRRFHVTSHAQRVLEGVPNQQGLSHEFFETLSALHEKRAEAQKLASVPAGHTAGTAILDELQKYHDIAFETLYRAAHQASRQMSAMVPDTPQWLIQAFRQLSSRPVLLQSCRDEIVYTRRAFQVHAYHYALTQTTTRPIQLHAADPVRYQSELLAYLHQSIASEQEWMSLLLEASLVKDLLSRVMDDVVPLWESVVKQTLARQVSSEEPLNIANLYKTVHIFLFYSQILSKLLHPTSLLMEAIVRCLKEYQQTFMQHWQSFCALHLVQQISLPSSDGVPRIQEPLMVLKTCLSHAAASQEPDTVLLDTWLDALAHGLQLSVNRVSPCLQSVYSLNVWFAVSQLLQSFHLSRPVVEQAPPILEQQLIQLQTQETLKVLGLQGQVAVSKALFERMAQGLAEVGQPLPEMMLLSNTETKLRIQKQSAAAVLDVYRSLVNVAESQGLAVPWKISDLETLLGI